MSSRKIEAGSRKTPRTEFTFTPRVINPVKINQALIFAADEEVRNARAGLAENMPWVQVDVAADPLTVSSFRSGQACVFIMDDTALIVADTARLRRNSEDGVVILLSSNDFIHRSPPSTTREKYPFTSKADLIFAVDREKFPPNQIIPSAVRCAEDLLNIKKYARERRFIFLIVDDEPRWFSEFLPVLYNIIGQRADVMLARTYEEALAFLFGVEDESGISRREYLSQGHGDDVVCVISDIFFPRGEDVNSDSGRDLIRLLNTYYPRIPVIIASKAQEAYSLRDRAFILPKGDPGTIETLREYIQDFTGLGDFIIHRQKGEELFRLKDIQELNDVLEQARENTEEAQRLRELLEGYAEKDVFSTWLYMHGFREAGDLIRPLRRKGLQLVAGLKELVEREIEKMRFTPLVVGGRKVFNLRDFLGVLKAVDPLEIQKLSDNDVFSTWLDRKAYPELAEEFRPIHGRGVKLREALAESVEKWVRIYQERGRDVGD